MTAISNFIERTGARFAGGAGIYLPGESGRGFNELGYRPTPEDRMQYISRLLWVDSGLRAKVLDIRKMDQEDPRVKKIHRRTASAAIKGGLILKQKRENTRISREWHDFVRRLKLDKRQKLTSDARGFVMEGNLPLQWILDTEGRNIVGGIRMPSETILPLVGGDGLFKDVTRAYAQIDLNTGRQAITFPLWQLTLGRLTPQNYDDMGSMGRPYLDASRAIWRKLIMTETDLVVRRHERAPLRLAHALEGASDDHLAEYEEKNEQARKNGNVRDFYSNSKLSVTAMQGDQTLDKMEDIVHLVDTFFSGAPGDKALFGYTGGMARDVLEDIKRDFYEEIDALQDELADIYQFGFELQLLLRGINPQASDFQVQFAERRTETANQAADRALKYQALGASQRTTWEAAGLDPDQEIARREDEAASNDPYPDAPKQPGNVSITPGNARKGGSSTTISTRN